MRVCVPKSASKGDFVTDPDASARERLYEVIQETAGDDKDLDGTVLVGFMVVAEWRGPDGGQWLSKVSGDHGANLPTWRQRGFAAEVLHDMWGDQPEDVED
jgi:hypothetical protein